MTDCSDPLCVSSAIQLDRLLSTSEPGMVPALRMRIAELEELVARQNRSVSLKGPDVEILYDLSQIDPRTPELDCFFCFQRVGAGEPDRNHRPECIWVRAVTRAEVHRRNDRKKGAAA